MDDSKLYEKIIKILNSIPPEDEFWKRDFENLIHEISRIKQEKLIEKNR